MGTTRTFGCEIECVPGVDPWRDDNEFYRQYVARGLTRWERGADGTVNGRYGAEIRSPILSGAGGIASIEAMCGLLNDFDTEVNRSCGLHVHVAGAGLRREQVCTLDRIFEIYEVAYFGMAGRGINHRMKEGSWCKPKKYVDDVSEEKYQSMNTFRLYFDTWDRKPTDVVQGGTIEVRAFGPTTNWKKIAGAVFLSVGLVEAVAADYPDFSRTVFNDPRLAMSDLLSLISYGGDFLPEGVTQETIAAVFDQCHTQARNAAEVLRIA